MHPPAEVTGQTSRGAWLAREHPETGGYSGVLHVCPALIPYSYVVPLHPAADLIHQLSEASTLPLPFPSRPCRLQALETFIPLQGQEDCLHFQVQVELQRDRDAELHTVTALLCYELH